MSYKINYTVTGNFLKVSISGEGGKNIRNISTDIRELIAKYKVNKILVDTSQSRGQIGIFESIEHIENYPPDMRELQSAVIGKPEDKQHNSFFENAAVNRGFRIFFFYNEDDALKWLDVESEAVPELVVEKEY